MKGQPVIPLSLLLRCAQQVGLECLGAISLAQASQALQAARGYLEHWQNSGYAGQLQYMLRPAELFTTLEHFFPQVQSLISFSVAYQSSAAPALPRGFGRIARYAWGADYHTVIKQSLAEFASELQHELGCEVKSRAFTDAVPLLERALAAAAGLGFAGKNTMLIAPGAGSFSFVAELLLAADIEFDLPALATRRQGRCGNCARCQTACPTNAFSGPYLLDGRRCISYLTIEKKGLLSEPFERAALGEWLFGCDVCQEVCPFNHRRANPPAIKKQFLPASGVGPALELEPLLKIASAGEFAGNFGHTALMRAGRERLLRNALCVAVNTAALGLIDQIRTMSIHDESVLVRRQAELALLDFNQRY